MMGALGNGFFLVVTFVSVFFCVVAVTNVSKQIFDGKPMKPEFVAHIGMFWFAVAFLILSLNMLGVIR